LQAAALLAADVAAGRRPQAPAPVPLGRAVADYLAHLRAEDRSAGTLKKYRGVFDIVLRHLAGQRVTRLDQFTVRHFDGFRTARAAARDPMTVYADGVIVKQFFTWARSRRLLAENPLAEVRLRKPPRKEKGGPSLAEVDRILAALPAARRPLGAALAFTGMRAGELQRLTPADLDLADDWLHVVSRRGLRTKTGASRKVPVHPRLRAAPAALPPGRRPWLFTAEASAKYPKGDHRVDVRKLNEAFLAAVRRAGRPQGRVHAPLAAPLLRDAHGERRHPAAGDRRVARARGRQVDGGRVLPAVGRGFATVRAQGPVR